VLEYANFLRIEMTAARRGVLTRSRHPPSRATDESAWLWTSSAAEMAGCSLQTVQRAIRKGELPAVRLGGRYLIEKADLLPWIAERKHR
jgi:excisionase family DNA binding protein